MSIIREIKNEHFIYEDEENGLLVAISKDDQKAIKKYWKSKGKTEVTAVPGHPMVVDEEHNSLKIDFSKTNAYNIQNLKLFK